MVRVNVMRNQWLHELPTSLGDNVDQILGRCDLGIKKIIIANTIPEKIFLIMKW